MSAEHCTHNQRLPLQKEEVVEKANNFDDGAEVKEGDTMQAVELSVNQSEVDTARVEVIRLHEICKGYVERP